MKITMWIHRTKLEVLFNILQLCTTDYEKPPWNDIEWFSSKPSRGFVEVQISYNEFKYLEDNYGILNKNYE